MVNPTPTSFYTDGTVYDEAEVVTNDHPSSSQAGPSTAPTSFYPDGNLYDYLSQESAVVALLQQLADTTTANANAAASSASNAHTSETNAATAVQGAAGTATPLIAGTAAVGTSTKWAHEDHVHPKDTTLASVSYVDTKVASVVNSAPATLDTLNELATALGNDPNFATTVSTQIGLKAPSASPVFTGAPAAPTPTAGDNSTRIATTAFISTALSSFTVGRIVLAGAITLFVSASGSDSNNGLTSGTPFLTVQKAINVLASKYDLGGQVATVSVGAGSFAGWSFAAMVGLASPASIIVNGAGSTTIITSGISCVGYGVTGTIANMQVATGASNVGISVAGRAHLVMTSGITFGANVYHAAISQSSSLNIQGNFTIAASCTFAFYVSTNSMLMAEAFGTCTLTGSPAWAGGFIYAENGSAVRIPSNTFSGASTGPRYQSNGNATIFVNGAGATYLPGSTAGTTSNGGLYI